MITLKKKYFYPYNYFEFGLKYEDWGYGPGNLYRFQDSDGITIYTSPLGLYDTSEFYIYIFIPLFLFIIYRLIFQKKS